MKERELLTIWAIMEINQDLNKPVDDNSLDTIEMKEAQEQHPAKPEPLPQPESPEPQPKVYHHA